MEEKKYYSTEEVSKMLGLHVNTIRRHVKDGRLKAYRFGRQWRFTEEDLKHYMKPESGEKGTNNE